MTNYKKELAKVTRRYNVVCKHIEKYEDEAKHLENDIAWLKKMVI